MRTPLFLLVAQLCGCASAFQALSPESTLRRFGDRVQAQVVPVDRATLTAAAAAELTARGFTFTTPDPAATFWTIFAQSAHPEALTPQLGLAWARSYTGAVIHADLFIDLEDAPGGVRLRVRREETYEYTSARRAEISFLPRYERFSADDPYLALRIIERADPSTARRLWAIEPHGARDLRCALGPSLDDFDAGPCKARAT